MISLGKMHPHLSASVESDPKLAAEAEALVHKYAGEGTSARIQELAHKAAVAAIDLRRLRQAQNELSRGLPSQHFGDLVMATKLIQMESPARSMILALDRYERGAVRRYIKASGALDAELRRRETGKLITTMNRLERSLERLRPPPRIETKNEPHDLAETTAG